MTTLSGIEMRWAEFVAALASCSSRFWLVAIGAAGATLRPANMKAKLPVCLLWLALSIVNGLRELRVGIAVRTVNPDPLLPVSGGVGPSQPAARREGDLTVRALVLEQQGTRIA